MLSYGILTLYNEFIIENYYAGTDTYIISW